MNWHIGQRIVAVREHSQGAFRDGDEFYIKGLRESPCRCKEVQVDIGMTNDAPYYTHRDCGERIPEKTIIWWFSSSSFLPLDDLSNHTADSLMEEMDLKIKIVENERISI